MGVRQTHTYATLEVSVNAYDEIAAKLREAGYDHVFNDEGEIDMHGLALVNYLRPPRGIPAGKPTVLPSELVELMAAGKSDGQ